MTEIIDAGIDTTDPETLLHNAIAEADPAPLLMSMVQITADHAAKSLCIHCNKCMPTIFYGTHCPLVTPKVAAN